MSRVLALVHWTDLLDIVTVGVLIWIGIRFLRHTRGRAAFAGMALLGVVYLAARALELRLTAALFQGFFAVGVLVLVVVFQEELRRFFEQVGSWLREGGRSRQGSEPLDALVRAVARLASARTGALIVLPGREPLESHVEGGVALGGRVSEPLLLSLFDTSSPGHDGAVILRDTRVEHFAVHLPLSSNHAALGPGGTRHAAALGLAERCDATCIVVSEERGTVSVARDGEIHVLARPGDLARELAVPDEETDGRSWLRGDTARDTALAALAAVALWVLFVPGSDLTDGTVSAEVRLSNLPPDLELESIAPETVEVTVRGPRRALMLTDLDMAVYIDAYLARFGRRTFQVDENAVRAPAPLDVIGVEPDRVVISLRPTRGSDDAR